MTTLQTSHTDKFTSAVFTKALLVTFPLGCMSASRKLQTPLQWQRFCSALGYKHFLHMHMLHVFYFIPCKDEMSILVFIVTVLLLAAIKIPYSGCRCCCTGISFNKTYKSTFWELRFTRRPLWAQTPTTDNTPCQAHSRNVKFRLFIQSGIISRH